MARPLKPAPHPWRKEDHQGKGYKIIAADGTTVCLVPMPKTMQEHTTLRLLLNCGVLLERSKSLVMFWRAFPQLSKEQKDNPTITSMAAIIDEIEKVLPPEKPQAPEVL
jgi:hypothetical protein